MVLSILQMEYFSMFSKNSRVVWSFEERNESVRFGMKRFNRYAWFVVSYNVLVILWGAVVRATGSGAGCGNTWPQCNGELVPRSDQVETLIEYSHRLTSGLAGVFVIIMLIWAYRVYKKGSAVRLWAAASFGFILLEGWIGMLLVRKDLVAYNQSAERAFMVALHLVNTMLMLGCMVVTAWLSNKGSWRWRKNEKWLLWVMGLLILATLVFNAAGAVTALGDTLFPPESLAEGLLQDLDPASNFLIRLRVIHPVLAVGTTYFVYRIGKYFKDQTYGAELESTIRRNGWLIGIQWTAGLLNVFLLAPIFLQILHLLFADLFWINLIMMFGGSVIDFQKAKF